MNSKITRCMENMYSVYRGKNARVKLNFKNNTLIKKNKFDLLYESNSFKVYTPVALNLPPSTMDVNGVYNLYQIEGILCKSTKTISEVVIDSNNRYYIDVKLDDHLLSNVSEDILVKIDGVEYPTTRNFFTHINKPIPVTSDDPLDYIFVLTIPDYGIRLFKKGYREGNDIVGYFKIDSVVTVECLEYTTADDINYSEYNKIIIPGTELIPFNGYQSDGVTPQVPGDTGRSDIIPEIPRDDERSPLYNANYATRTQSSILSSSDVNVLFTEHFIDYVKSSVNSYSESDNTLYIYYVPRAIGYSLSNPQVDEFVNLYRSYFITHSIRAVKGELCRIQVSIDLFVNNSEEILDDITEIFNKYKDILCKRSSIQNPVDPEFEMFDSILNEKMIRSEISKLSQVAYIDRFYYSKYTLENGQYSINSSDNNNSFLIPTARVINGLAVPMYYNFELNINYMNTYEIIS
jgi:hypothetical protein